MSTFHINTENARDRTKISTDILVSDMFGIHTNTETKQNENNDVIEGSGKAEKTKSGL